MMKLHSLLTGYFKLDGGAMFGIVPRRMWAKMCPPDENNLCKWAMRCLLIDTGDRIILVDTGLGDKQDEKFRSHFMPFGDMTLMSALSDAGYKPEDITDVLLTHLHFDHCGGAVALVNGIAVPAFPNATYWSNERHWNWALNPNPREAASFLKENFVPLQEAGVLRFIPDVDGYEWLPGIRIMLCNGHTEAMMVPIIETETRTIVFSADTMPSVHHLGMPYVMAYDMRPLDSMNEKETILQLLLKTNGYLFFEHDEVNDCASIKLNEKGKIVPDNIGALADFF